MSVKSKISAEFEQKRRAALMRAADLRDSLNKKYPELSALDAKMSAVAMEYTRRLIAGENVKDEMQSALADIQRQKNELLESYGVCSGDLEPKFECSVCEDRGTVDGKLCRCFKKRIIEENFKNSNIGSFLKDQTFERFDLNYYSDEIKGNYQVSPRAAMERILLHCTEFADRFDDTEKSIFMSGGTGLGKTFLSTCIAKEVLKKGKSVIYISAVDFFKCIEQSRFDADNKDVELFESCDLLIVDDLGTEALSLYTTAVFSDILDKRVSQGKKLILSTNNNPADIEKLYGERVFSRIVGYFRVLLFRGDDIRLQKFKKGI